MRQVVRAVSGTQQRVEKTQYYCYHYYYYFSVTISFVLLICENPGCLSLAQLFLMVVLENRG